MSSQMHQMQLNYDQLQDRLTLILGTQDFNEYRFWLTRRATRALWSILIQLLHADQKTELQHHQEEKKITEQIQKEKTQHQPNADKYGTNITRKPFGEEPLLIYKIMAKPGPSGASFIHFEDIQGHSIEFGGDSRIIMALCQLIRKTVKNADWDLNLEMQ